MRYKLKFLLGFLIAVFWILPSTPVWALPPFPANFYGTVTMGGANVPDGTTVTAACSGTVYASTTTSTYSGDSVYTINVPGDDPDTSGTVEGCVDGETVTFTVDGQVADQTGTWHSDASVELNLTAPLPVPDITAVIPNTGIQGASLSVTLEGDNTMWDGTTTANFGPGITVTLTVTDTTHAGAALTIGDAATPGTRTITLTTGAEVVSKINAFTVQSKDIGVHIDPPTQVPAGLQDFPVAINLDTDVTGKGIYDFAFTLLYDTAVLSASGASSLDTLSEGWPVVVDRDVPGQVTVVGYNTAPLSGQEPLLNLLFDAVGTEGASSALSFSNFEFNDGGVAASTYTNTVTLMDSHVIITGQVTYYQNANPVPGVTLDFSATTPLSTTTDATGFYTQTVVASDPYTAVPTQTQAINDALSALDASVAARYKAGLISLTAEQQRACDVSGDAICGSHDASSILRYMVSDPTLSYPVAQWRFDPASRSYTSLMNNVTNENYTAYLLGDITANWANGGATTQLLSGSDRHVQAKILDQNAASGDTIIVPIVVSDLTGLEIFAFQGSLEFDPRVIQARSVQSEHTLSQNGALVINLDAQGKVEFADYELAPLEGDGALLIVKLEVVGEKGTHSEINLDLQLNEGEPAVQASQGRLTVSGDLNKVFLPLVMRR